MKNPFVILLSAAAVLGIAVAAVAILFFGTSDDTDEETIPVASQSDLPTPSSRNEALSRETAQPTPTTEPAEPTEAPEVSTTLDEPPDQESEDTETESPQAALGGRGGVGAGGGGPGGGNFQTIIQEAMAENPELAELFQKAQSGNITQQEQAQMQELMQELLAEAGIEAPTGRQGGGFGAPPTQGTISAISGSTLTIDHNDDSGLSTDIEIPDNTNITVIRELTPADLSAGTNVAGTVQRGEGGRIFILNLNVLSDQLPQSSGYGGFRGTVVGVREAGDTTTNISVIDGAITEINDQQISVETTQGTLRLTANEDSNIITTNPGTISDITQGMAAIAFGGNPPNNLIVGPETLLQQDGNAPGIRGR